MSYNSVVIQSFRCPDTERLFAGEHVRRFVNIEAPARRKLRFLQSALAVKDLFIPAGNRLEALKGDRQGQYSIRIDDRYRICFRWHEGNAHDVEIVDYH